MSYVDRLMSEGESKLLTTRHHWFLLIGAGWAYLLLLIVGVALGLYGSVRASQIQTQLGVTSDQYTIGLLVLELVLVVFPIIALIAILVQRQFDQVIVTNYRVLNIQGVFSKRVMDSSLEKVNDILLAQSFLGRMFDYGDLEILTASEVGVNRLTWISRPVELKHAMLEAKQDLEGGATFRSSIPDLIAKLAELRDRGALSEEEYLTEKAQLLDRL